MLLRAAYEFDRLTNIATIIRIKSVVSPHLRYTDDTLSLRGRPKEGEDPIKNAKTSILSGGKTQPGPRGPDKNGKMVEFIGKEEFAGVAAADSHKLFLIWWV